MSSASSSFTRRPTLPALARNSRVAGVLLCLLLCAGPLGGQTNYYWENNVTGDWFHPGNWTPDGPPDTRSDVYINNGIVQINSGTAYSNNSVLGDNENTIGTVEVSGSGQWINGDILIVGNDGTGTLTIQPGGRVKTDSVIIADNSLYGTNKINLNGDTSSRGVLETDYITRIAGAAQLDWNGGILRATDDSTSFLHGFGLGDVVIQSGGGFFDTNGFDVTITTPLSGAGGFNKLGAGVLTLTRENFYNGSTAIQKGTLQVATHAQLGSIVDLVFNADLNTVTGFSDPFNNPATTLTNAIQSNTGIPGALATYNNAIDTAVADGTLPVLRITGAAVFDGDTDSALGLGSNKAGAIHLADGASLTFQDFDANFSGGAIYLATGSLLDLRGGGNASSGYTLQFSINTAGINGGAIYNDQGTLSVANATFSGNESERGGAIYNNNGTVSVANATFSGNEADIAGGAIYNESSTLSVANATFSGNEATNYGGAIYNNKGTLIVSNSTFSGNKSVTTSGGAIDNTSGTLSVANSSFLGNESNRGGAIENYNSTLNVSNVTFSGNKAATSGGAIRMFGTTTGNLSTTSGQTGLFTGNTAGGNANSIAFRTSTSATLNVHSASNALLDMRDPMRVDQNYTVIAITQSGPGVWALGGSNVFTQNGPGKTTFSVNAGTLYLYAQDEVDNSVRDVNNVVTTTAKVAAGSLQLDGADSAFTLGNGATLVAGGNTNSITTAGKIDLLGGSTLRGGSASQSLGGSNPRNERGLNTKLTLTATGGVNLLGNVFVSSLITEDKFTLDAPLTGAGSLTKTGPGIVELTQSSDYSGGTTIISGTLLANNTTGSATGTGDVFISGGKLGGKGFISGAVRFTGPATISPGNSPGTLTVGGLHLRDDSTLEFELAQPGVKGGGVNDFIQVNGALTLAGKLALLSIGSEGLYHLIDYTGAFTNDGLTIASVPAGVNPGNLLVDTSTTDEVNLIYAIRTETGTPIAPAFVADTQYWDGGNANANGIIDGGSGLWVAGATNWTNIQGLVNSPWAGQTAVFRGTPGTVTLGSDIPFEKLIFNVGGYQIVSPHGYQLYAPGNAEIHTDTGVTSIAAPLTVMGLFTKSGAGTLELNAPAVTYGGTVITAGGLTVNSTLHSPFVNVHSGANLTVNGSVFAALHNHGTTLINPGGLLKGNMTNYGGATLLIKGTAIGSLTNAGFAHIFAGGLLVGDVSNSGHLKVNGTVDGSVRNTGLLTGAGLITGDVWNAGTVAPGNSIGTLTIGRNFTQTQSGTLQIEAASVGNHDILVVGGTAKLAGTLELQSLGYKAQFGDQIPFLIAGSIEGGFDKISVPNPARNRGRFVNYGNIGALLVAPASYTLVAKSGNDHRLARALDKWIGIEIGDIGAVTLALDLQREAQYAQSFSAISPAYYEGALSTGIELSHSHSQLLHQQLNARRLAYRIANVPAMPAPQSSAKGAKAVAPEVQSINESDQRWSAWTQGSGLFSSGGLSLTPGEDFESGAILVGADYLLTDTLALGLFASYQEGWGDYDHSGDIDLDATRFGAYATYDSGGFYANTALGFGQSSYNVKRPINWAYLNRTATSEPDAWEFFTSASAGYDLKRGNWTFGPQLSLQYSKLTLDEFSETGAGALNLRLQDTDIDSLRTYLGGRIAYTYQVSERFAIIPEVRAFWQHEFLDGGSANARLDSGNGPSFTHQFSDPDEDSFYLGAGIGFQAGASLYFNLYYNLDLGRNEEETHTVSASATVRF